MYFWFVAEQISSYLPYYTAYHSDIRPWPYKWVALYAGGLICGVIGYNEVFVQLRNLAITSGDGPHEI